MEKWKRMCGKIGKDRFLILIIGGLLLLVITYPLPSSAKNETPSGQRGQNPGSVSAGEKAEDESRAYTETAGGYEEKTEAHLAGILSSMNGAGKVRVFISFADSGVSVVEKDVSYTRSNEERNGESAGNNTTLNTENSEKTVYTVDEGGNEIPFVSKTCAPKVEGVLVVAQGGGNQILQQEMKEAIMALFGIEEHKIKVVKMKGEER